jgi:1-acyl-sn-glycerol-3-phosphate acyltransferase
MKFDKRIYWVSFWLIRAFYRTLLKGDIQGLSNVPASHLDPPLLGCNVLRIVTYFARKTLWKPGLGEIWMTSVGAIPVDRDGESDIRAMKSTLKTLKNGGVLTLFPEGTRSPDGSLQSAKPGIGLIAAKSQSAVVPCRISIHIVYGKPLQPEDYDPGKAAGKARYQQIADNIITAISQIKRPRAKVI